MQFFNLYLLLSGMASGYDVVNDAIYLLLRDKAYEYCNVNDVVM